MVADYYAHAKRDQVIGMAEYSKGLKGSRALIKDIDNGELLAETVIADHDVVNNIITISKDHLGRGGNDKVSVLVFAPKGLFEYNGTIRRDSSGINTEIAIYKEKEKNDRKFLRYDLVADGVVDALYIDDKLVELRRGIPIHVKNISANGILFSAGIDDFPDKQKFRLNMDLRGKKFVQIYQVVRTQKPTTATIEYGCQMVEVDVQLNEIYYDEAYFTDDYSAGQQRYYDEHMANEQNKGYLDMAREVDKLRAMLASDEVKSHPALINDVFTKVGGSFWSLYTDMVMKTNVFTPEFVFNCCSYRNDESIKDACYALNITLLALCIGRLRINDEDRLRNLIKLGLSTGFPYVQEIFDDEEIKNLIEAAQIYNFRATKLPGIAVLPLSGLDQMYFLGQTEDELSLRGQERLIVRTFMQTIKGKTVKLFDGTKAVVMYFPANDISHPIFMKDGYVWQAQEPNYILGVDIRD